ncbi:MAG TPA: LruC domain-containing protein [Leptospiraceae bacterium]|nr:LruC domain-containing protein [Leptospiraceae bacterium]HMW05963.1 LruC domain-containing protein [Leptospiraceae bacterium]HMX32105.1 LruC domain-containing protein [Leptospiraceae bacterium]HMY32317.1 LruC domain-containing protein [Leptospiraceae bacterium]HMZ62481.1 LruC domain-containing protein [Leptospiraceae bacterium]
MKTTILLLSFILFFGCSSKQDPNYLWLVGLAQSTAAAGVGSPGASTPNVPANPSVPSPVGPQNFTMTVSDNTGTPTDFLFDTTKTLTLDIVAYDFAERPATGALVQIGDANDPDNFTTYFQAVTNPNGNVTGSFTVNSTTSQVNLIVTYNGIQYKALIDIKGVYGIRRSMYMIGVSQVAIIQDTDKDGVPDSEDIYPNDPTRSAKVNYPPSGYYTVSFEDLYPNQGDADFNDYSVRVRYEEDLNAKGEVSRVRGYFQHVAKGAGYNHILRLSLPSVNASSYTLKRLSNADIQEYQTSGSNVAFQEIEILPASNTTLSQSNTASGQTYTLGKKAELEVILSNPVPKTTLGAVPYDLYIYVINTKYEIHFAGKFKKADGSDQYLDSNGFPWAVLIPGNWKWPYERVDVRKSYSGFQPWYQSKGTTNLDWYNFPNLSEVFPSN